MLRNIVLICLFLVHGIVHVSAHNDDRQKYYKKFEKVFDKIVDIYVKDPDQEKMIDDALSAMLRSLDPHSDYFSKEDFKEIMSDTQGYFGGIGVELTYDSGLMKVISPIDDLPAYKAGIKAGDYIISVDGESVNNLGFSKAARKIRGEPGTKVTIKTVKEDDLKPKEHTLTREVVKINSVKYNIDNNIAYIRIVSFNENTSSEFNKAVTSFDKNVKGIILDLRNNPGGIFEQALAVSEYFLNNQEIVSLKGKLPESKMSFNASKFSFKSPNIPVVVLINMGSASAAEIVAGALQDNKRAIILGTESFGKGSVQTVVKLDDGTGMKVTTALYYTPSGKSIQAEGIKPDIVVEQAKVDYLRSDKVFSESKLKNFIKNEQNEQKDQKEKVTPKENNKLSDEHLSEMYKHDYQYSRAFDLIVALSLVK